MDSTALAAVAMGTRRRLFRKGLRRMANDLWRMSACAVVELLRCGKVSPVELIDAALARIAAVNPKVNALVTLGEDRARAQAKRLMDAPIAARGRLHRLPIAFNDLHDVAG